MEHFDNNVDLSESLHLSLYEELDLPVSIPSRYLVIDENGEIRIAQDVDDRRQLGKGQGFRAFRQAIRQLKTYIAEKQPDSLTYRSEGLLYRKTSLLYRLAFYLDADNYLLSLADGRITLIRQSHSLTQTAD